MLNAVSLEDENYYNEGVHLYYNSFHFNGLLYKISVIVDRVIGL